MHGEKLSVGDEHHEVMKTLPYRILEIVRRRETLLLLAILAIGFLMRMAFVHEPLERDEGIYATIGQEILWQGIPYRDVIEMKPPGSFYLYALMISLAGPSLEGIRMLTALYALATTIAIYWFGVIAAGSYAGLWAAFFFAVFSGVPQLQGSSSNTEVFMLLPMVLASCFLLKSNSKRRYRDLMLSGLFAGIALFIKTVAAPYVLLLCGTVFMKTWSGSWSRGMLKDIGFFLLPLACLGLGIAGFFYWNGALEDLFYWNYTFLERYAISMSPGEYLQKFVAMGQAVLVEHVLLWLLAIPTMLWIILHKRDLPHGFTALWLLSTVVGVCMPGHYYPHYYIQLMPPLALLSGMGLSELWARSKRLRAFGTALVVCGIIFLAILDYKFYFVYSPEEVVIAKYGEQGVLFSEAMELGHYLKANTAPDDYVFQWGFEPEIFFYANRRTPSRFILFYTVAASPDPWEAGEELKQSLMAKLPKYIIVYRFFTTSPGYEQLREVLNAKYSPIDVRQDFVFLYKLNEVP